MSTAETVKKYVVAEFRPDITVEQLSSDYDLLANGVIDSLSLLRLISWLRTRFDVPVDDVDITPEKFRSIDAICAFVRDSGGRE